jgi:hypothetical protein
MSRHAIIKRQQDWAVGKGYAPDQRGYLPTITNNLRAPLSAQAEAAFRSGSGGELRDRPVRNGRPARPAKMKALHSSAVLAVNIFDYWTHTDPHPLAEALGLDTLASVAFEAQHPTGLPGIPPNLDLEFRLRDGKILGVESKFTEWLTPKRADTKPFKTKYFPEGEGLWSCRHLLNCQAVAGALQGGDLSYLYLNAPQLLKHALGLATTTPHGVSLMYLYYEVPGKHAETHRTEIADFAGRLKPELNFRALTYQDLFSRMRRDLGSEHGEYITYLRDRYFTESAA